MDLMELIKGRRSIRSFNAEKRFDEGIITKLIEAAVWAPSGGNIRPLKFFVVESDDVKKALYESSYRQKYILEAPYSIVVCIDKALARSKYHERGLDLYSIQDSGAAVQNILLTAFSLGLGTCWIGAFEEEKASLALGLDSSLRPVAIIPVGFSKEKPVPPKRESVSSYTVWLR